MWPSEIPFEADDLSFTDEWPDVGTMETLTGYVMTRNRLSQYIILPPEDGWQRNVEVPGISPELIRQVQHREIDWQGYGPNTSKVPCMLARAVSDRIVDVLSLTIYDETCFFRGHPWHDGLSRRERVASVKPWSRWIYIYIQEEGTFLPVSRWLL